MEGEEKLERISCRSGLARHAQGFSVGNAGRPRAPRGEEAAGHVPWAPLLHHRRAGCHWRTDSQVSGAPKAGRNWHGATAELFKKTEFVLGNCFCLHQKT